MLGKKSRKSMTAPAQMPFDAVCRICLESKNNLDMIHPCKCLGSVRYVHEKCLKTWVSEKHSDIEKAKCELCQSPYNMIYKVGVGCASRKQVFSNLPKFYVWPVLIILEAMIAFLIYLLFQISSSSSSQIMIFKLLLIGISMAAVIGIAIVIAIFFKQIFFVRKVKKWAFYNSKEIEERNNSTTIMINQLKLAENSRLDIPNRSHVEPLSVLVQDVLPETIVQRKQSFHDQLASSIDYEVVPAIQSARVCNSEAQLIIKKNNYMEDPEY